MKKLVFVVLSLLAFACSKSDDISAVYWNPSFTFSVYNADNEDLLSLETIDHYDSVGIKLFYKIGAAEREVYDAHLDYPRRFRIFEHENEYRIEVGLNYSETPEKSITYIQWGEDDRDTIEALFERTERSLLLREAWFNGELIWDWTTDAERYYRITKEIL
ncbi:MAG: hypothetical protein R6U78_04330 [Bacteroidales bacterium]